MDDPLFNGQQQRPQSNERKSSTSGGHEEERKRHNYKLLTDPHLKTGPKAVHRFDGVAPPGEPPVQVRDPRSRFARFWKHRVQVDLPVPQLKYDEYYIGTPLPKEVTFTNLNDNIGEKFLEDMCKGFGAVEDCKVYFHPQSRKHLGIGKAQFTSTKAARMCVDKYNNQSKMGNIMKVFLDTMGKDRQKLINDLTNDGRPPADPQRALPPPNEQDSNPDPRDPLGLNDPRRNRSTDSLSDDPSPLKQIPLVRETSREHDVYDTRDPHIRPTHDDRTRGLSRPPSFSDTQLPGPTPHTPVPAAPHDSHYRELPPAGYSQEPPAIPPLMGPIDGRPMGHYQKEPPPRPGMEGPNTPTGQFGMAQQHVDMMYQHHHGYQPHRPPTREAADKEERRRRNYSRAQTDRHRDFRPRGNDDYGTFGRAVGGAEYPGGYARARQHPRERGRSRDEDPRRRDSREWEPAEREHDHRSAERADTWSRGRERYEHREPDRRRDAARESDDGGMPRLPEDRTVQHMDSLEDGEAGAVKPPLGSPPPQAEVKQESPEPDRHMSLESRINLLLGQAAPEPDSSEPETPKTLRPESDHPVLNGDSEAADVRVKRDEDEMSISSGGSADGFNAAYGEPAESQEPPPGLPAELWNQNYFNMINNQINEYDMSAMENVDMEEPAWTDQDNSKEELFTGVMDQIIDELKNIMKRDISKKMIVKSAFSAFDDWWQWEEKVLTQEKPADSESVQHEKPPEETSQEIGSGLSALFDNRDGGVGMGGFLGLRGALPKMPSFRKIKRPKTPPPEDEYKSDDEAGTSRRGPQTPTASSSDSDTPAGASDFDEPRRKRKSPAKKRKEQKVAEIYSSDESASDSSSSARSSSPVSRDVRAAKSGDDVSTEAASQSETSDLDVEQTESKVRTPDIRKSPEKIYHSEECDAGTKVKTEDDIKLESSEVEDGELADDEANDDVTEADSAADTKKAIKTERPPPAPTKPKKGAGRGKKPRKAESETEVGLPEGGSTLSDVELPTPPKRRGRGRPKKTELMEREAAMNLVRPGPDHSYSAPQKRALEQAPPRQTKQTPVSGTDSASEGESEMQPTLPPQVALDHNYCLPYFPLQDRMNAQISEANKENVSYQTIFNKFVDGRLLDDEAKAKLKNITSEGMRLTKHVSRPAPVRKKIKFSKRSQTEERLITFDCLIRGVDHEDINFLKRRYEELLKDDSEETYWLNDTHWVDHPVTVIPDPPRKRHKSEYVPSVKHKSGCARTEGYYKVPFTEKASYLSELRGITSFGAQERNSERSEERSRKLKLDKSREAKAENRRLLTVLGEDLSGDLLKFNHLKFRRKQVKFCKSSIHNWGLFALETIPADEMVIEYVGQMVRSHVADKREQRYEAMGIGSSYLFRVDSEFVIDATKCGNLGRFINHCCNPNCTAKVITVDNTKKIVIYSKREIAQNEEVTYDYKFPIEDEKIPCFCGASQCRKYLN